MESETSSLDARTEAGRADTSLSAEAQVQIATAPGHAELLPAISADQSRPRQAFLVHDRSHRIVHASRTLARVLRIPAEVCIGGSTLDSFTRAAFAPAHPGDEPQPDINASGPRILLTANDARTIHAQTDPLDEQYSITTFDDVTARLDAEREMEHIAYHDRLTGIGNRALLEVRLDQMLARLQSGEVESVTVLFLDLDRFKIVNDTLGHAVGDELLRLVSARLQSSIRASDTLARMGGDEFAILLEHSSRKDVAMTLAKRAIDLIQRTYLIEGNVVNVGASIGIAVEPEDGSTRDALLKSADLALYHSKNAGRGVFHFFEPAMEEKARQRRALELDLRKALMLKQFELHYQPQVDVKSQAILGMEALLRWRHPQRGLVAPADFMPVAQEIGLLVPLGEWALRTACREAKRWPDHLTVAVNASALQLEMGTFAETVERALTAAELPGNRLEIEINEETLQRNGKALLSTLDALHALGVRVAMDSFGVGLASLSQVVTFPFDKIKIDRSLIGVDTYDTKNRAIVRAVSALGQTLGISTLAAGVETQEHLAQVQSEGCQSVQGFFYSRAVPAADLGELFTRLAPAATLPKTLRGDV